MGRSCSQEYLLFLTPPRLSAIPTVFGGALCAPLLKLVWKGFLESLYESNEAGALGEWPLTVGVYHTYQCGPREGWEQAPGVPAG